MLTEIRDRSSGWLAWIIAAIIIIPMAFWGVQEYANPNPVPTLVTVGDQKITQNEFQAQLNNAQQRQRQAMGDRVNNELLNSDFFKQNVLEQMINRALIEQVAETQNYQVSDQQLVDFIKQSDFFQIDGKFDQDSYDRYILSTQFSKTQFEKRIRDDNRVSQVMSGYQDSALVLPDEVRELLSIQAEQRTFDLITVRQQDYKADVNVSDQEISDYYADNEQQFLETEKVSIDYVELDVNQLLSEVEVDEEELKAVYEDNVESYISEERRQTRHILLSTTGGEDDAAQKAKAVELVSQLQAGADFAELAKANSQDPGSAANGGDLGLVEKGQMVEEFEQATFSLAKDQISEPIKSQFGYHIIQVVDIEEPEQQPFEEVKFDIEQDEKQRLAEEMLLSRVDQMRDLAYEQPESLDGIAEELSLNIQSTELFDRNQGVGLATNATIRERAFSEEILVDEVNSEPIEVSEGRYVVLRKQQYKPSEPKPLESVSAQIKTILVDQKASEAAAETGSTLLSSAEQNWQSLVDDEKVTIDSHTISLADTDRKVTPAVLRQVATMRLDGASWVVDSVVDRNGDFNIIRLSNIAEGDVNQVSEQVKESTRRLIEQRNGQSLVSSYLDSLREEFKPEIDETLL